MTFRSVIISGRTDAPGVDGREEAKEMAFWPPCFENALFYEGRRWRT
jgi:hypothetical protein